MAKFLPDMINYSYIPNANYRLHNVANYVLTDSFRKFEISNCFLKCVNEILQHKYIS